MITQDNPESIPAPEPISETDSNQESIPEEIPHPETATLPEAESILEPTPIVETPADAAPSELPEITQETPPAPVPDPIHRLHIGSAYYPEHWEEARWPEDIRLMKEAGLTVVRMAEFAWSTLEPSAGQFNFAWLDRAIELLAENGIKTVLGTPTASPPAWLCQKYPDLMAVEPNGLRVQFGNRVHYCVNSPEMHSSTGRLIGEMAKHFGANPNVIGWQIDNEFNRVCYCPHCQSRFTEFLRDKYASLDDLNRRWSTAYWSQTYSDWAQIPIPIGEHNPALMLDFNRFVTASYRTFLDLQINLIKPHLKPDDWITHNFMGWFDGLDHYEMSADIDIASLNWYLGTGHNDHIETNAILDLSRGFKRKNFWVMETQPGSVDWSGINNSMYKGEGRTMAWQAIAHGAEGFLYWQWRPALNCQEQFHGSLIDQSGQPRPFYEEIKRIAREFTTASNLILGSEYKSRAAILNDYESRWSLQWQRQHKDFDYVETLKQYYRPFAESNTPVDIISADAPLDGYRLVIVPAMVIIDENRFNNLKTFVQRGGNLVLTARTAMKDRDNALLTSRAPGPLRELAGVEVQEYFALDEEIDIRGNWFTGTANQWAELLNITDNAITTPAARYEPFNGWLDETPAITVHGYQSGLVYYVAVNLDKIAQSEFMKRVIKTANINPVLETPAGVQAARRTRQDGSEIVFLINHTRMSQIVDLPKSYHEHLKGLTLEGRIEMAPYGVAVMTPLPA